MKIYILTFLLFACFSAFAQDSIVVEKQVLVQGYANPLIVQYRFKPSKKDNKKANIRVFQETRHGRILIGSKKGYTLDDPKTTASQYFYMK